MPEREPIDAAATPPAIALVTDAPRRSIANSQAAFARARQVMPGGVSSPVRAFKAVGGTPVFIKEGDRCFVTDLDGKRYVDYVASYGPLIVGHANERVVAALSKAIGRGTSFGMPTESETQLASVVCGALPSVEMVRFVNSGTEATMSAIRLARAATGREIVVKCIGCYHGHSDGLLVQAGGGALTPGAAAPPGGAGGERRANAGDAELAGCAAGGDGGDGAGELQPAR